MFSFFSGELQLYEIAKRTRNPKEPSRLPSMKTLGLTIIRMGQAVG
jgi:hypothetical protein